MLLFKIFFPTLLLVIGILLCLVRKPLSLLISLIMLSIISSCTILVLMDVQFFSITFILIYIGAIMMLFLFIVMMFNLKSE